MEVKKVTSGFLPLSFRKHGEFNDKLRVNTLLRSLARCWVDKEEFVLTIVVPDEELEDIENALPSVANIRTELLTETECLAEVAPLAAKFDWWRRQQLIKLIGTSRMASDATIIFNSDIVAMSKFDGKTFVKDGKLISEWEPKSGQDWWNSAANLLESSLGNFGHYGLSVAPNIISCQLARENLDYFTSRWGDFATVLLHAPRIVSLSGVAWTDFSIYTLLAEMSGKLDKYHVRANDTFNLDVRVRSRYSVWSETDLSMSTAALDINDPDAVFICVQSAAKIDPIEIDNWLLPPVAA